MQAYCVKCRAKKEIQTPISNLSESSGNQLTPVAEELPPDVTVNEIETPMRDGVILRGLLFLPKNIDKAVPALLCRSAYPIELNYPKAIYFAQHGYAVYLQHVRGRRMSDGEFSPWRDDAKDGYDTIEWMAKQDWCNGNVGTFGGSYMGMTQSMVAPTRPPHLKAQWVERAPDDCYTELLFPGGAFGLSMLRWCFSQGPATAERMGRPDLVAEIEEAQKPETYKKYWFYLPRVELPIFQPIAPWYYDWLRHYEDGPFWDRYWQSENNKEIDVPIYHLGGWYDRFDMGVTNHYLGVSKNGFSQKTRESQKLRMGPWTHFEWGERKVGDLDFGPEAELNLNAEMVRWFDYHLKGIDNGIMDEPPVKLFVMGDNTWRSENEWPLARTEWTKFYLKQGPSSSIHSLNDGILSTSLPDADEHPDRYVSDPNNPLVIIGGGMTFTEFMGVPGPGPRDNRPNDRRSLTFTSQVLDKDVEVTGPITVKLYASSSALDTDWVATLTDVYADGYSQTLQVGVRRASFNDTRFERHLLEPGKVYLFTINVEPTSHVFKKGHRIRLTIASSAFPQVEPNPQTGHEWGVTSETQVAVNRVYHDIIRPSHVILPIIPRD